MPRNRKTTKHPEPVKEEAIAKNPPRQRWQLLAGVIIVLILALAYLFKGLLIAAVVNGRPIYRPVVISELEKQGGKQTLDSLITQDLIVQEAARKNITVSQKEIDDQLKTIESNISGQGLTLDQALQQQGMTKNDLINQIKLQLMLQKLVGDNVTVTDKEIEDYIAANKNQLPAEASPEAQKEQVSQQLKNQKEQQKIQDFITKLRSDAKISYFVNY